jgi:ribosomal protein S18 acetylase RimI-like enzyme
MTPAEAGTPTIRPLRPEDIDTICDIAVRAWEPVFAEFRRRMGDAIFSAKHSAWREDKAGQVRHHAQNHPDWVIVTELDGRVVGFLTFVIREQSSFGEIGNNAVDPDHQGRGFGSAQCERALEIFREKGLKHAEVWTGLDDSHAPARAQYEKVGFWQAWPAVTYMREL